MQKSLLFWILMLFWLLAGVWAVWPVGGAIVAYAPIGWGSGPLYPDRPARLEGVRSASARVGSGDRQLPGLSRGLKKLDSNSSND